MRSRIAAVVAAVLTTLGCKSESPPPPPAPPTSLGAAPGDARAVLSWTASAGATGYVVYYSSSLPVLSSSPHVAATGTSATVTGLTNGAATYFAVSATGEGGESALSSTACAVPTASDTTGLVLHDALCGTVLDGHLWRSGTFDARVSGGAAVVGVEAGNEESRVQTGLLYGYSVNVMAPGHRVTTVRSTLSVPAAGASRTGGGQIRGAVQLVYQPPALRLGYPGPSQDALLFQAGLIDTGGGLYAFRVVGHCDNPSCSAFSATGVTFSDPAGFAPVDPALLPAGTRAAYDTTYTVSVSLDETTGIFHWSIAGGALGAGVEGTADPSAYLAATPGWTGVPLGGAGFAAAGLHARTEDDTTSGGGAGKVSVRFGDVQVGLDGGASVPWDDFSGSGGNSGPVELSPAKWVPAGATGISLSGGSLVLSEHLTSVGANAGQPVALALGGGAVATTALQAEVAVTAHDESVGASSWVAVQGRFYNDGAPGGATSSALGDVGAGVFLYPATGAVNYSVMRCSNAACSSVTIPSSGAIPGASVGTALHAVRVAWDPTLQRFTFTVDGSTVTVDAPTAVAGPANSPFARIFTSVSTPAASGAAAGITVRVNNVFVAP